MTNPEEEKQQQQEVHDGSPKVVEERGPAAGDVENRREESAGVAGILRRWKREDLLRRGSLGLRGLAFLFSLLSFIIMASNKHGDWKDFDRYEEYRYILAIAILTTLYSGGQCLLKVHELSTGKYLFQRSISVLFDFSGDQIAAYLLISAASAGVPMTNRMRESQDNIFTDSLASSISMSFFAFFALALSAVVSGYKLSNQSYI